MGEDLWYKNAIIYSLNIETFMDVNGDGVGDFEGLNRRLDYIHALGVDTIWLAPFQPTPNKDNGYDVSDYYGVDRRLGSSGDFVEFMHKANRLGIKVLIDLVVNHTSDEHPWFKEAGSSRKSYYRQWYIWSDKRPPDWDKGMVFPGVQKSTWTYHQKSKAYYFHRFYDFQPELNMDNPEVRDEVQRIMGYWLQLGVAGFRVDAVPYIIESPTAGKGRPRLRFEYLREMRRFLQWRRGDAILLGEANILPKDNEQYFGEEGAGMHMMFNFFVNQRLFYTLATADTLPLIEALEKTKATFPGSQWAQFLRNHDELDLGRLTKEQRQKVFDRFGPEDGMQLYERGIRRRLHPMLGNRQQIEMAYSMLFSLPGTPVIRYGDEIGMGDDLSLPERNSVRTPMQWSGDPQAGFTKAQKAVLPLIDEGPYAYAHVNVEAQRRDPGSLLNWMTSLIRLRKECPEIGWGDWQILETGLKEVLGICYSWRGNSVMTLHNFADKPYEITLNLEQNIENKLIDLMRNEEIAIDESSKVRITLEAYGYKWFRTRNLSHLLNRTK